MKKNIEEIRKSVAELAEYQKMAKELESTMDILKTEIKEYMDENHLEDLLGDHGEHVVYKEVRSNRFDSSLFKKSGYEKLYEAFTKVQTTKPFKLFC